MVKRKHILIRADASERLGHGHIYRCLTLADSLRNKGAEIEFAVSAPSASIKELIGSKNFKLHVLSNNNQTFDWQEDARSVMNLLGQVGSYDWLIVDHYLLHEKWEALFYKAGLKLLVIDDLAQHRHHCHYLLNQTFNVCANSYAGLVNNDAHLLLGAQYALLRPEFNHIKQQMQFRQNNYHMPKIHVFFGSTDPFSYAYKFSKILLENFEYLALKVVTLSHDHADWKTLRQIFPQRIEIHGLVSDMALNMADCDLAFGAPGMATWERGALGISGIYLATNDNQINILNHLQEQGFCYFLGSASQIEEDYFIERFREILRDQEKLQAMSQYGFDSIDALGCQRVSEMIMEY